MPWTNQLQIKFLFKASSKEAPGHKWLEAKQLVGRKMPQHCSIGTELSICKILFDRHMLFAGNKHSSGKHTCTDENSERLSKAPFCYFNKFFRKERFKRGSWIRKWKLIDTDISPTYIVKAGWKHGKIIIKYQTKNPNYLLLIYISTCNSRVTFSISLW